ncbi:MAG: hypothetical protein IJV22_00345 [Bacteroidales bacterium]|nr:hypothetical protein [Bacteroidales bacterium]
MMRKSKKNKMKRVSLCLSTADVRALDSYSRAVGLPRAIAMRRLLHDGLQQFMKQCPEEIAANQLGLFDVCQTELFSGVSGQAQE